MKKAKKKAKKAGKKATVSGTVRNGNDDKLSVKERTFCREYIKLKNGTKAAAAAGYARKSAKVTASRLLTKVNLRVEIKRLEGKLEDEALLSAVEVERKLDALICFNLKDYVNNDGKLKSINELTPEQAACVRELGVIGKQLSLKFFDKVQAIKLKMQRLGMLKENVEHSGGVVLLNTNVQLEEDELFSGWLKESQALSPGTKGNVSEIENPLAVPAGAKKMIFNPETGRFE